MDKANVQELPKCDFCGNQANYDGKTIHGPWANMCLPCFGLNGVGLGVGRGQLLETESVK